MRAETDFPFIVWANYGTEGWRPRGFDTLAEALAHVGSGLMVPFVLTQRMALTAYPLPAWPEEKP